MDAFFHKPIKIYMGVLILEINTLYMIFCFVRLHRLLMVGKGLSSLKMVICIPVHKSTQCLRCQSRLLSLADPLEMECSSITAFENVTVDCDTNRPTGTPLCSFDERPLHQCKYRTVLVTDIVTRFGPSYIAIYSASPSLLKIGRYHDTTMCHYWDTLVK